VSTTVFEEGPPLLEMSEYQDNWVLMFEQEKARLEAALGDFAVRIDHVGSTSVQGMTAKPVIDIQISVRDLHPISAYKDVMQRLGYTHLSDSPPGDHIYPLFHFPATWPHTHHVHFCELGGHEEWRHLVYRDWLRRHPEARKEYSDLKVRLAAQTDLRDPSAMDRYADGKSAFVEAIEHACRENAYVVE
jgi:GrpB-like predicted nucleotidyltransferase (UPF0157 family)